MKTRFTSMIHKSGKCVLRLALVSSLVTPTPVIKAGQSGHDHEQAAPAKLVQIVRDATRQFIDVNAATAAGYGQFLGCVSGPDHGAMGIHYVKGSLVADGLLDASQPEALIYEPTNGKLRTGGRRVHRRRHYLAGKSQRPSAGSRRSELPVRWHAKPVWHRLDFRAARLGMAGQPQRCVRGLEQPGVLRR